MCIQRNSGPAMTPRIASDGTLFVAVSGSARGTGTPHGPITGLFARSGDLGESLLGAAGALVAGGLVLGAGVHNAREAASSP